MVALALAAAGFACGFQCRPPLQAARPGASCLGATPAAFLWARAGDARPDCPTDRGSGGGSARHTASVPRAVVTAVAPRSASAGGSAADAAVERSGKQDWYRLFIRARPWLVVAVLVLQKCAADGLTWYTRTRGATAYSGSSVAFLSEVLKFPVLAVAIAVFESPKRVIPTFRNSTRNIWFLAWVAAAYAAQNLLYFVCLDNISPAGYQVLSQTKLIFTAGLMSAMLGKRFSRLQVLAMALLVCGALFTQLGEMSGASILGGKGNVALGCGLTVLSSLLSSLPNVFYERVLKSDRDEWTSNVQMTIWILFWVAFLRACSPDEGLRAMQGGLTGLMQSVVQLTAGFTPAVWLIVFLKTWNCVIIPACLKYADNILYSYAKPVSIVLTCVATSAITSSLPVPSMMFGFTLVLISMWLYGRG